MRKDLRNVLASFGLVTTTALIGGIVYANTTPSQVSGVTANQVPQTSNTHEPLPSDGGTTVLISTSSSQDVSPKPQTTKESPSTTPVAIPTTAPAITNKQPVITTTQTDTLPTPAPTPEPTPVAQPTTQTSSQTYDYMMYMGGGSRRSSVS